MMTENVLARIFEHHLWANLKIIQACAALPDDQLDAEPVSATRGTIRRTLQHLVGSEQHYVSELTGTPPRHALRNPPSFSELQESAQSSGETLLALARDADGLNQLGRRVTQDKKYYVDPWVVMVQAVNHASEHREQIKSMLTALGVKPPNIDGWDYGEATKALVPITA
jgi:uncharacterized damage-inducible protein DinB